MTSLLRAAQRFDQDSIDPPSARAMIMASVRAGGGGLELTHVFFRLDPDSVMWKVCRGRIAATSQ